MLYRFIVLSPKVWAEVGETSSNDLIFKDWVLCYKVHILAVLFCWTELSYGIWNFDRSRYLDRFRVKVVWNFRFRGDMIKKLQLLNFGWTWRIIASFDPRMSLIQTCLGTSVFLFWEMYQRPVNSNWQFRTYPDLGPKRSLSQILRLPKWVPTFCQNFHDKKMKV